MGITINSSDNEFLALNLKRRLENANIDFSKYTIEASSPETGELPDELKDKIKYIGMNIYKGHLVSFFNLLQQDKATFIKKVDEMKISDNDKKILKDFKNSFDTYYSLNIQLENGKSYNVLNLQEGEIEEIEENDPVLAEFIKTNSEDIQTNTRKFTRNDLQADALKKSGESSRDFVPTFLGMFAGLVALGQYKEYLNGKGTPKWMNKVFDKIGVPSWKITPETQAEILAEEKEILAAGHPIKNFFNKYIKQPKNIYGAFKNFIKGLNPKTILNNVKGKSPKALMTAAIPIIFWGLTGSLDDCLGAYKDRKQDAEVFGKRKANEIFGWSIAAGVVSSLAIAPLMEATVNYNKVKYAAHSVGKLAKFMPGLKNPKAILANMGLGILFSMCTSGSSWMSEALTLGKLSSNRKELVANNIVEKNDKESSSWNNFWGYEAYSGKAKGITATDWSLGSLAGGSGLLFASNPVACAAATTTLGCSETMTACFEQETKDGVRRKNINQEKEKYANSCF